MSDKNSGLTQAWWNVVYFVLRDLFTENEMVATRNLKYSDYLAESRLREIHAFLHHLINTSDFISSQSVRRLLL